MLPTSRYPREKKHLPLAPFHKWRAKNPNLPWTRIRTLLIPRPKPRDDTHCKPSFEEGDRSLEADNAGTWDISRDCGEYVITNARERGNIIEEIEREGGRQARRLKVGLENGREYNWEL